MTGLWAKFDPRELATPDAFARNPKLVWDWYAARRAMVAEVEPNPAHYALAELERQVPDFLLATQNVDGLHQRAGSAQDGRAARQHHAREMLGVRRCRRNVGQVGAGRAAALREVRRVPASRRRLVPRAAAGGCAARAEDAARRCDVLLVVGTSAEVYPAAELPEHALRRGARVVEVNPHATPLSARASDVLRGPAGVVLPALVQAAFSA